MKKLGRVSSMLFTFASLANSSFAASSTGSGEKSSLTNIGTLAVGALLICCVLFIGYKMDKSSLDMPTEKKQKPPKKSKASSRTEVIKTDEMYDAGEDDEGLLDEDLHEDMPYEEEDESQYFGSSNEAQDESLEESEYEEDDDDDVSLFSADQNVESSFENVDDNLSFENEEKTFGADDSTTVFDTEALNNKIDELDNDGADDFEYTDAVEGLDEKIASLDDLDDETLMSGNSVPENTSLSDDLSSMQELQDLEEAESFMNDLRKYEEMAETDDFGGFSTSSTTEDFPNEENEEVEEVEEPKIDILADSSSKKRYTRKKEEKVDDFSQGFSNSFSEDVMNNEVEDFSSTSSVTDEPSSNSGMDMGFLAQMEANLMKNQEERIRKSSSKSAKESTSEKKTTRKKKED